MYMTQRVETLNSFLHYQVQTILHYQVQNQECKS